MLRTGEQFRFYFVQMSLDLLSMSLTHPLLGQKDGASKNGNFADLLIFLCRKRFSTFRHNISSKHPHRAVWAAAPVVQLRLLS